MKKEKPSDFYDLENPAQFNAMQHTLLPYCQDDAMGGVFGVKLGQSSERIELETLFSLDKIRNSSFDLIIIDYGNSAGDASKLFINISTLSAFFLNEAPL
jgi:hypothetical protein